MAGRRATGGPAAAPALALACALAWLARASCDLAAETAGKCAFMETAFVETFSGPTLNSTRWVQASLNGLFHCNKGTERFCTMASSSNFQTNQSLPFYPFGNATGAVLTLTQARPLQAAPLPLPCSPSRPSAASLDEQDPCNNPFHRNLCCAQHAGEVVCANWTGAHAISKGCILYGVLTAEMGLKMPRGSQALWDFGTYINGGEPDPTWNEIDMIFRMGMLVPAASANATVNGTTRYVESQLDTTFFNPGEHKETFDTTTVPRFDGYIARQYHNFSIYWTPTYIAWTLDEVVFRNVNKVGRAAYEMRSPWRPATFRLIFHTGNGSLHPLPSAHVYIKRLAYTPLQEMPLLASAKGTEFAASALSWGLAYAVGMVMLACGARAIASNRHHQILEEDETGLGQVLQPLLDVLRSWGGGDEGEGEAATRTVRTNAAPGAGPPTRGATPAARQPKAASRRPPDPYAL